MSTKRQTIGGVLGSIHSFNIIVVFWKNSTPFFGQKKQIIYCFEAVIFSPPLRQLIPPRSKKILEQTKGCAFQK